MGTSLSNINSAGQILGDTGAGGGYNFIYNIGSFTVIDSGAAAFNDNGQIVGQTTNASGTEGFLEDNGAVAEIAFPGTPDTEPYGINNAGQIVGWYFAAGYFTGFIDSDGTYTAISDPVAYINGSPSVNGSISGGGTLPKGINDQGQIVGSYINSSGTEFGFIDTNGTFSPISDPLAFPGLFLGTEASGINDAGDIVGWYYDSSEVQHGFLDAGGVFTTIDYPGAVATGITSINSAGDLVGFFVDNTNTEQGFEAIPDSDVASGYDFSTIDAPCFLIGTEIATRSGMVAVERLTAGDRVTAHFGGERSVVWTRHFSIDCERLPDPSSAWPVRIAPHAFGPDQPGRALFLSPDHAVFIGDVLIPVRYLINGETIVQIAMDEATYYHVELRDHDLLLAEGLLVESYLRSGDRSNFANIEASIRLFRDSSPPANVVSARWEMAACAPLIHRGPKLEAARQLVSFSSSRRRYAQATVPA
jgi:hypothetical protein